MGSVGARVRRLEEGLVRAVNGGERTYAKKRPVERGRRRCWRSGTWFS